LINSTNESYSATMLKQIYNSGFLISFGISGGLYLIGSYIWKPTLVPAEREGEFEFTFEYLGKTDGYFPGDQIVSFGRKSMRNGDIEEVATPPSEEAIEEEDKDKEAYVYGVATTTVREI
jgi:hypothetical protein